MDEGALVGARIDAEQPLTVVRGDAGELEPVHRVAAVVLVDHEVRVERSAAD